MRDLLVYGKGESTKHPTSWRAQHNAPMRSVGSTMCTGGWLYRQWTGLVSHSMSLVKSNPGHEYCVRVRAVTILFLICWVTAVCVLRWHYKKLHLVDTSYQQAALPGVWLPLARQKKRQSSIVIHTRQNTINMLTNYFWNVTLVDRSVEIRRKLGLLTGVWCQHAFIILPTTEGQPRGRGSRYPWATMTAHFMFSMFW